MRGLRSRAGSRTAVFLTLGFLTIGAAQSTPGQGTGGDDVASGGIVGGDLGQRDRERIHPGDPLALHGLDQSDEGYRLATPALLRSTRTALAVDEDENRRRRIAMYEEGRIFRSPLPASSSAAPTPPEAASSSGSSNPDDSGRALFGTPLLFLPIALAVLLALRTLRRARTIPAGRGAETP